MPYSLSFQSIFIGILIYYALLSVWYTLLLIASFPEVMRRYREITFGNISHTLEQESLIPITVITPAYNEEKNITNMLHNLLRSHYKNLEVIVVNDGSTDSTLKILIDEFFLYQVPKIIKSSIQTAKVKSCYRSTQFKNLLVIDKEHSSFHSAADAINVGINACKTPIVLTIDADTFIEPEALTRLVFSFLSKTNCLAVGGSVYVLNEDQVVNGEVKETDIPNRFIPAVQSVEYLRSFLYGRVGWNVFGGALCIAGAFSFFETQALRDTGGLDTQNFSYDAEITIKLHHWILKNHYPGRITYAPSAFAWTIVPNTLKGFWIQRVRWQRGMLRSAFNHIGMLFNPKYGVVGFLSFPCYIFFEILGPVIEFISYILFVFALFLQAVSLKMFFWFIALAWGFITFLSVAMFLLNLISFNQYKKPRQAFKIIWLICVEFLGFRQFRAAACFAGTIQYFINKLMGKPL